MKPFEMNLFSESLTRFLTVENILKSGTTIIIITDNPVVDIPVAYDIHFSSGSGLEIDIITRPKTYKY